MGNGFLINKLQQPQNNEPVQPHKPSPKEFGLPHDQWRPHQYETVQWLHKNEGYIILSAPTGSGKTSLGVAAASKEKTIALCRTKGLQQENYQGIYGFDVLYGKGNYSCVHPEFKGYADTCAYADKGMNKCEYSNRCPYLIAKARAQESDMLSLNYAYYLSSYWPRQAHPGYLFLDEAHQLSDITLDWAGLDIGSRAQKEWDLPDFPEISGAKVAGFLTKTQDPVEIALRWLTGAKARLETRQRALASALRYDSGNQKLRAQTQQCESLLRKVEATLHAMQGNPLDWFIKSGATAGKDLHNQPVPRMIAKPLSAKYHFQNYFNDGARIIMMSATIGNPTAYANELGLPEYVYHSIPSQWPPSTRPVLDLGAPRLGAKAEPSAYDKQAQIIASAIKNCPSDWSGIIHVTRKTEAAQLAQRLERYGLHNRMWVPSTQDGTDKQMAAWERMKTRNKGLIAVSWTWWEGVNLTEEQICIVAKTPFPYLGDEYERARMMYSNETYMWRTATALQQALGRTRRGEPEDYDLNGKKNQLVAIADGNWTRVRNSMSPELLEAIVKL